MRNASSAVPFRIRPASAGDVPTIALFNIRMAWETEHLKLDPAVVEKGVAALFEHAGRGRYFVADQDGRVIGCLLVTHEWSDWRNGDMWWIQSVYVDPEARGTGVFRRLYKEIERLAREAGVRALRLYVERENTRAKNVYSSLGMQLTAYDVMHHDLSDGASAAKG